MFKWLKNKIRHKRFFGKVLTQTGLCILKEEGTLAATETSRGPGGECQRTTLWFHASDIRSLHLSVVELPNTADSDRALSQTTVTLYNDKLQAIPVYIGKSFQGDVLEGEHQHIVAVRVGIVGQYGLGIKSIQLPY